MCFRPSRPWNGASGSTETRRVSGLARRRKRATPTKVPLVPRPATNRSRRSPPSCCEDLGAGRPLVRGRVLRVRVLVGVEEAPRPLREQRAGAVDGSVRALERVGLDHLAAVGAQDAQPLGAGRGRDAERDPEAERGAEHRVRDAGVAARRVQQASRRAAAPARSAATTIARAARSFTLPPGLALSSFAKTRGPAGPGIRCSSTSGVRPTRSSRGCSRAPMPINVVNASSSVNPRGRTAACCSSRGMVLWGRSERPVAPQEDGARGMNGKAAASFLELGGLRPPRPP